MTVKSVRLPAIFVFATAFAGFFAAPISASTISVTAAVTGQSGPWLYSSSLNPSFQYGTDSQAAPALFSASDGFAFAAGNTLTITYVNGMVSVGGGFPLTDANGDKAAATNAGTGSSGRVFPSFFMNPATYPIYLGELVGAFATSSGVLVGTPFAVGDSATAVIPSGATQLQLGINDDIFSDNVGSYTVQVTGLSDSSAPEPSAAVLLGSALAGIVLGRRLTRASHSRTRLRQHP